MAVYKRMFIHDLLGLPLQRSQRPADGSNDADSPINNVAEYIDNGPAASTGAPPASQWFMFGNPSRPVCCARVAGIVNQVTESKESAAVHCAIGIDDGTGVILVVLPQNLLPASISVGEYVTVIGKIRVSVTGKKWISCTGVVPNPDPLAEYNNVLETLVLYKQHYFTGESSAESAQVEMDRKDSHDRQRLKRKISQESEADLEIATSQDPYLFSECTQEVVLDNLEGEIEKLVSASGGISRVNLGLNFPNKAGEQIENAISQLIIAGHIYEDDEGKLCPL